MAEFNEGIYNAVRFDTETKTWICKKVIIKYSPHNKYYATINDIDRDYKKLVTVNKLCQHIDVASASPTTSMYSPTLEYHEMKDMIIQKSLDNVKKIEGQLDKARNIISEMERTR